MRANEFITEDWNKANRRDKTDGLSRKAVKAYRRENPGSKLQTAVTTKPSKLKPGSKAAKRRKSFCARMSGNKGPMKKPNGKPTPKALALRRWNCESVEHMVDMIIENMDHAKDNQAVPELKAALLAKKAKLQTASEDDVYDIIDTMLAIVATAEPAPVVVMAVVAKAYVNCLMAVKIGSGLIKIRIKHQLSLQLAVYITHSWRDKIQMKHLAIGTLSLRPNNNMVLQVGA